MSEHWRWSPHDVSLMGWGEARQWVAVRSHPSSSQPRYSQEGDSLGQLTVRPCPSERLSLRCSFSTRVSA